MIKTTTTPRAEHEWHVRSVDEALATFTGATGSDHNDCLTDILCDLMHWADHAGFTFDRHLERARQHHAMEVLDGM